MNQSVRLSLLCVLLTPTIVDCLAATEDIGKNVWTVVGADRMDVVVPKTTRHCST